ncbi:hypothetical protein MRX96_036771 [Rhipicephalus microplus]
MSVTTRKSSDSGYSRRHSWSHTSLHEDDIEDLLPLIDKLAVDYANSDSSSAEGAVPEAAAHMPGDEGSWFSVLPETTRARGPLHMVAAARLCIDPVRCGLR